MSGSFTLYVDFVISSTQATLKVVDDSSNDILGTFTIQNVSGGVQILSTAPGDGNTITAGNSQSVTISGIFIMPNTSSIVVSTTLNSELEFVDVQNFNFDLNPSAFSNPSVDISLSNLTQDSPSDISFTISQVANEADIASSVITTDGGFFDISSLNTNDAVGFGTGFVAGGSVSGSFTILVDFVISQLKQH